MWDSPLLWVSLVSTLGFCASLNPLLFLQYGFPFCAPKLPFATILSSEQLELVASVF